MLNRKIALAIMMLFLIAGMTFALSATLGTKETPRDGRQVYKLANNKRIVMGDTRPSVGWAYKDPIPAGKNTRTIVFGFCCISEKPVFEAVIPAFKNYWKKKTGEDVRFVTGNGEPGFDAVATTTSEGFPIQVTYVSSGTDVLNPSRGFSLTKWSNTPLKGKIFETAQVFLVRKGNPLNIKTFADITATGAKAIHADPYDAGNGLFVVYGLYGSALRESEIKTGKQNPASAFAFLKAVEKNAAAITGTAKDAGDLFSMGYGDVLITSECKALPRLKKDKSLELVVPPITATNYWTLYLNNKNIPEENKELIDAFVDWLVSEEAQEIFANYGFRPSNPTVLARHKEFAPIRETLDTEYFGGPTQGKKEIILGKWEQLNKELSLVGKFPKISTGNAGSAH